jgi:hypothetical protein
VLSRRVEDSPSRVVGDPDGAADRNAGLVDVPAPLGGRCLVGERDDARDEEGAVCGRGEVAGGPHQLRGVLGEATATRRRQSLSTTSGATAVGGLLRQFLGRDTTHQPDPDEDVDDLREETESEARPVDSYSLRVPKSTRPIRSSGILV